MGFFPESRTVNLKFSKPGDFRFFVEKKQRDLAKNREIWPKTGRSLEFVEFIDNIPVKKVILDKQLMTKIIMGSVFLMVFNVFVNL